METQKIVNLLNGSDDENSIGTKLQQKKGMLLTVYQEVIIQMQIQLKF